MAQTVFDALNRLSVATWWTVRVYENVSAPDLMKIQRSRRMKIHPQTMARCLRFHFGPSANMEGEELMSSSAGGHQGDIQMCVCPNVDVSGDLWSWRER